MKKTIRILAMILAICLAVGVGALAADNYTKNLLANYVGVKLVVDGVSITPKDANGTVVEPFIVDGTTYLPVRAVAEALGKEVGWDGDTKTVYIGAKPQTAPSYASAIADDGKTLSYATGPFVFDDEYSTQTIESIKVVSLTSRRGYYQYYADDYNITFEIIGKVDKKKSSGDGLYISYICYDADGFSIQKNTLYEKVTPSERFKAEKLVMAIPAETVRIEFADGYA